jgi:hypothetical protein
VSTGLPAPVHTIKSAKEPLLDVLLITFEDAFTEPCGLPPQHALDHCIVLKPDSLPGSLPVVVQPYRYLAAHKDELE